MKNYKTILTAILLICVLLVTACGNDIEEITLVKPRIDKSLGSIPSLEEAEVIFKVDDDVFGKKLAIYKKSNDKTDIIENIKSQFDLNIEIELSAGNYKQYQNDDGATLKVYNESSFEFELKKPGKGITLSEKQMEEMAKQKLAEFDISLDSFERAGTYGRSENGKIVRQTICYEKKVDGYSLVGLSELRIGFANDEIYCVDLCYSDKEKEIDIKAESKAKIEENFIENMLDISIKNDAVRGSKIKQIEVTGAEIVYLDVHYDQEQPHIQPLYRFSGKLIAEDGTESDFESLMSAVPDEYFAED